MPSPFPGMNPYLENPAIWPDVHHRSIVAIADELNPQLRPNYRVAVEVRVYETIGGSLLVGIPDVTIKRPIKTSNSLPSNLAVAQSIDEPISVTVPMPEIVRQGYLEVREVATREVVTVIELLSPVNKRFGQGRNTYESKRLKILGTSTHLVEIDLLRNWEPMPIYSNGLDSNYRILVSRGDERPKADLYAFNLQDLIPSFHLPLKSDDREPVVNLQKLLDEVYDRASYDLEIDYMLNPAPPLSETDLVWIDEQLKEIGLR